MSDDKSKTDPPKGDGTGPESTEKGGSTTIPFGELLGTIDSRIQSILGKSGKSTGDAKSDSGTPGASDPQGIREQLRTELAKLQGEEAAAKKQADQDVTIEEIKAQVAKLTEEPPAENFSKLTQFMWGKREKK